ncbi:UDP-glucose dehydrogenase [hydrothermal vent metagenome]|uniref:UDP-glucose dehydrogenase n=1 Tax=hydrothermal vent metagenome TaxID=652676 RepID=A0A1W1BAG9_9ZZZZ
MKKVCVVGLGYIGLPTASLLANRGYEVIGVDVNKNTVDIINQGKIHIVEPDLDTFVQSAVQSGKLKAYLEPKEADIFMICVPTPFYEDRDIPTPNLDYVLSATKAIMPYVKDGNSIILESTSPVGATELVTKTLKESGVDITKLSIAYCPERVLPGKIMFELTENDRIIGGINRESALEVEKFYKTFVNGELLLTDCKTAEMSKLVENSYRDVNIAFANELSILSDKLDINIWELISLANRHPRVNILQPSSGVGGHCIAVDPWFIVSQDPKNARLIKTAREVNNYKTQWCIEKVKSEALSFELKNSKKAKVALMGLAFKPNIDDLRESPALFIAQNIVEDLDCLVVEPNVKESEEFELIEYQEALSQADIVVFLVAHREFKEIDTQDKIVVDFCGVIN